MSISVAGQYYLQFDIASKTDFIDQANFIGFDLIEEAGNVLPTFQFSFYTNDASIPSLLQEGNDLKITFGKSNEDAMATSLVVTKLQMSVGGVNMKMISCVGFLSSLAYINSGVINITPEQSGVEAIIAAASQHFIMSKDNNITASDDVQRWIQPNESAKSFISKVWMHCDLPNSFPAIGISSDGQFIIKDMVKDIGTAAKYNFTNNPIPNTTDIGYLGNPQISVNTGFINSWVGYDKQRLVYDINAGTDETITTTVESIISLTSVLSKRTGVTGRFDSIGAISGNTHANYWSSFQRNLTYLAAFGNLTVMIKIPNLMFPVKVLDKVMLRDTDAATAGRISNDFNSGVYYVSKVARNIVSKSIITTVFLCRESVNFVRNLG